MKLDISDVESTAIQNFLDCIRNEKTHKKWVVNIKGEKLQGRYCLLHFKPKEKN